MRRRSLATANKYYLHALLLAMGVIVTGTVNAQSPTSAKSPNPDPATALSFDVSTIKPAKLDNNRSVGFYTYPGGRILISQMSIRSVIAYAFSLPQPQVVGGPAWLDKDLFEISALPPQSSAAAKLNPKFMNTPFSSDQKAMLQSLLAQRFGMKYKIGSKEGQVFFLMRNNKPLKMQESKTKDGFVYFYPGYSSTEGMAGTSISMGAIASRLSHDFGRPILDKTQLKGVYDFKLDPISPVSLKEADQDSDDLPHILEYLSEVGLKLQPGKAPLKTIVIEDITMPTAN